MEAGNGQPEFLAEFEENASVIYAVDAEFRIRYCNAAWDRFAMENGGSHLLRETQTGVNVMNITPPPLRPFYSKLFGSVLKLGEEMHCVFECSSDRAFRRFHMEVRRRTLPARNSLLVVVNTLVSETPQQAPQVQRDLEALREEDGFIRMCSHCRRTRLPDEESRWVWLPDLVREMPKRVHHDICPVCFDLHYRS